MSRVLTTAIAAFAALALAGAAGAITGDPEALQKFTDWLRILAATYPQVKEFVVGNEPNLTRFWQPQFNADGSGASGIAFAKFLAASYDALKEVNENITVVGVGYARLGREKPIMDVFGFHPYPAKDRDSLAKGYRWPNAGVTNLARIKQ